MKIREVRISLTVDHGEASAEIRAAYTSEDLRGLDRGALITALQRVVASMFDRAERQLQSERTPAPSETS